MYRILIIGQSSFIGNNFKKYSRYKTIDSVSVREKSLENINFGDYDIILHLAAIVHQNKSIPNSEYFRVNRDLCLEVARNAKKARVSHFVFMSTIKVYGDQGASTQILNESSLCTPMESYGKSKYEAELGLKKIEDGHFKVAIVRTPLVYGEGVKANMYKLIKLVEKFPILPFSKLSNKRTIIYIENLVGYIDRIIEKQASGVFIVQDEKPVSTTELVDFIALGLSRKVRLIKLPKILLKIGLRIFPKTTLRLFGSLEFDNTFTKEKLNYKPVFTTEIGVKKMVKYYINNK